MSEKTKKYTGTFLFELISAAVITCSVIPGFNSIGHLLFQVSATAVIIVFYLLLVDSSKITPVTVAHSLIFMTVYWIAVAIYKQVMLHIKTDDNSFNWRFIFYYDKPALLLVAFMTVIGFFAVKYIFRFNDEKFCKEYKSFLKIVLIAFLAYYFIVLFYCFFLSRNQSATRPEVNFIPFDFFRLMKEGNYEYEYYFLMFGNIAVFFPLGLLLTALFNGKHKILLVILPFVISGGIELLQYIFRYGWPDIDDVIFNVLGFYIGVILKICIDKIIYKVSKGKIKSVFIF